MPHTAPRSLVGLIAASAAALVAAQLVASPASAADPSTLLEVSVTGTTVTVIAGSAAPAFTDTETLIVQPSPSGGVDVIIDEGSSRLFSSSAFCLPQAPASAPVTKITCGVTGGDVSVNLSAMSGYTQTAANGNLPLTFIGGSGQDDVYGGDGQDTIDGGPGDDNLFGDSDKGNSDDKISGGPGNDDIEGGGGNDEIDGGDGSDSISGEGGEDRIIGGIGVDSLYGDEGADFINSKDGIKDTVVDCGPDGEFAVWDKDLDVPVKCKAGTDETSLIRATTEMSTTVPGTSVLVLTAGVNIEAFAARESLSVSPSGQGIEAIALSGGKRLWTTVPSCTKAPATAPVQVLTCKGKFTEVRFDYSAASVATKSAVNGQLTTTFVGGSGDDELSSSMGDDDISGGAGNDKLNGNKGADTIRGGPGNDGVYGGDGSNVLFGEDGTDTVSGGINDDRIDGGPGADTLLGGGGANFVMAKDDTRDSVVCGTGTPQSTARYDKGLDSVSYCTDAPDETNTFEVAITADAQGAPVVSVVAASGVPAFPSGEVLTLQRTKASSGVEGVQVSFPKGWARLWTKAGQCGPVPAEEAVASMTCTGTFGSSSVDGSALPDTLRATVVGNLPSTIVGSRWGDVINGGSLVDDISSGDGDDQVNGGEGADIITTGKGQDTVDAGPGADVVKAGPDGDTVNGGAGKDIIKGEGWSDTLRGGPDDDLIDGGSEPDTMYGDAGKDVVQARDGTADTVVDCEDGKRSSPKGGLVTFDENLDNPVACTPAANENITIRVAVDDSTVVAATAGPDIPAFGEAETLVARAVDGGIEIATRDGAARLWSDATGCTAVPVEEPETSITCTGTFTAAKLDLSQVTTPVHLVTEGTLPATLIGGSGADTLEGGAAADTINAGPGNDQVAGGDGGDTVLAGAGIDTVNGGPGGDTISGEDGNDLLYGDAGSDTIKGGPGRDSISGGDDPDTLYGDADKDTVDSEDGIKDAVVNCDGTGSGGGIVVYDVGLDTPQNCTPVASTKVFSATGVAWGGILGMPITDADVQVHFTADAVFQSGNFYDRSKSTNPSQASNGLIAFQSTRDGTGNRIYVMNADGSNVRQLTFVTDAPYTTDWGYAQDTSPVISPDGTKVAFLSPRAYFAQAAKRNLCGFGNDIFVVDIATKKISQVTPSQFTGGCGTANIYSMDWNDAGTKFAYRGLRYIADKNGKGIAEVRGFIDANGKNETVYRADYCTGQTMDWVRDIVLWSYGGAVQGCQYESDLHVWNLKTGKDTVIKSAVLNANVGDGSWSNGPGAVRLSPDATRIIYLMGNYVGGVPRPTFLRSIGIDGTGMLDTGSGFNVAGGNWIWWSAGGIPPATTYTISPAKVTIQSGGDPVQLTPKLADTKGKVISVSGADWQFADGSPYAGGLKVSQTGLLTVDATVPAGTYVVQNSNEQLTAKVTITVR